MAKKRKKGLGVTGILVGVICAVGAVMMMPTTMVFVIGMVPTAVGLFSDTSNERTAGATIGPINFAGVLVALLELWEKGHTVDIALDVISEPVMLLCMYGAAGVGAFIYVNLPNFIAAILKRQAKNRIERITKDQEKLIDAWGDTLKEVDAKKKT